MGVRLDLADGDTLLLLPGRAVWHARSRTLLVADVHVGKAVSFRRLGVPVPAGTTGETLSRLSALAHFHDAARVVFLGDFLHSASAHAAGTQAALRQWREQHADLELTLVRGNHDDRAGDPSPALCIKVVDEPHALGTLLLAHHPLRAPTGQTVVAGHLHPCIRLQGPARQRLRLPCFHWRPGLLVVPAFGAFTGMHPVTREAGDRVFAVADEAVVELP